MENQTPAQSDDTNCQWLTRIDPVLLNTPASMPPSAQPNDERGCDANTSPVDSLDIPGLHKIPQDDTSDDEHASLKTVECKTKGLKPGNKGRWRGDLLDFFESRFLEYSTIPKSKGAKGKAKNLRTFWLSLRNDFWDAFSFDDARKNLVGGQHMSDEEVMAATNQSMKSWMRYREKHGAGPGTKNPWKTALSQLRKPLGPSPRPVAAWQVFHSQHANEIAAIYEERVLTSPYGGIKLRNEIAQEQWGKLSEEQKRFYEDAAKERHKIELGEYEAAMSGDPVDDVKVQAEARRRLCDTVTPLLKLISAYTGFQSLTLLCGGVPKDGKLDLNVGMVSYGKSAGPRSRDFTNYDPEGFGEKVIGHLVTFLHDYLDPTPGSHPKAPKIVDTSSATIPPVDKLAGDHEDGDDSDDEDEHTKESTSATTSLHDAPTSTSSTSIGQSHATASPASTPVNRPAFPEATSHALRQKVAAMPEDEQKKKQAYLHSLDAAGLALENDIAAKEELILGITGPGNPSSTTSQPSDQTNPTPSPAADQPSSSIPQTSSVPDRGSPLAAQSPPIPSPTVSSEATPIQHRCANDFLTVTNRKGWPKWFTTSFDRFATEPFAPGHAALWAGVLSNWVDIERSARFAKSHNGFFIGSRPSPITTWIQGTRRSQIVINDASEYKEQFDTWWKDLNPNWRTEKDSKFTQEGTGDWSVLFRSGSNGFLNVLTGFVALKQSIIDDKEWCDLLVDMAWVLKEVRSAWTTNTNKRAGEALEDGRSRRTKKPKNM